MDDGAVLVYHIVRSNGVGARVGIRSSIGACVGIRSSVGGRCRCIGLLITTGGILRLAACDYAKDQMKKAVELDHCIKLYPPRRKKEAK